jgi:hypothetical protein
VKGKDFRASHEAERYETVNEPENRVRQDCKVHFCPFSGLLHTTMPHFTLPGLLPAGA